MGLWVEAPEAFQGVVNIAKRCGYSSSTNPRSRGREPAARCVFCADLVRVEGSGTAKHRKEAPQLQPPPRTPSWT